MNINQGDQNQVRPNYSYQPPIDDELDPQFYLRLFWNRRWVILSIVLAGFFASSIYFLKQHDIYKATSQIIVEFVRSENPLEIKEVDRTLRQNLTQITRFFRTEKYIIESEMFLKYMLENNEDLISYLHAGDADTAMERLKALTKIDMKNPVNTNLIDIEVVGTDPVLVSKTANKMAEAYVKKNIADKLFISKQIMEWFPEETAQLHSQTIMGQLENLSKEEVIEVLPSINANQVINKLKIRKKELEQKISEISRIYKDKFPKMIETKEELARVNDEIDMETEKILRTLRASLAGELQLNTLRITNYASVPKRPSWPDRPKYISVLTLISLFFALVIVLFLEQVDRRIRSEDDLKRFGIPFLGYVHLCKKGIDFKNRERTLTENFSYVRTSVLFSIAADSPKTILVTSALPSEGKSTVSYLLSKAFSDNKNRVLIVEGDIRNPTLLGRISEIDSAKGLTDFLIGDMDFDSLVYNLDENLAIVPCGFSSPNPTELLGSNRMKEFIKEANRRFDWVIIDSPPILGMADGLILAKNNTQILLVIDTTKIDKKTVATVKDRLEGFDLKIMGAVLNRIDPSKMSHYSYHYYYYNKYYKKHYATPLDKKEEVAV